MGPPPGVSAPGTSGAPGMQQSQQGGLPQNFDPRASMPGINFAAPVIRLGMSGQDNKPSTPNATTDRRGGNAEPVSNRRGMGLGYEARGPQQRDWGERDNVTLPQQTREEVARTLFIGNITEAFGTEDDIRSILDVGGGLRNFIRAFDADRKPCAFGFAEYDNADNLAIAVDVLSDVQIISKDQPKREARETARTNGAETDVASVTANPSIPQVKVKQEKDEAEDESTGDNHKMKTGSQTEQGSLDERIKMDKLRVLIDDESRRYIDTWRGRKDQKSEEEADKRQFAVDHAREELDRILKSIANPLHNGIQNQDVNGEPKQQQTETVTNAETGEIVEIPIAVEDELSDIPAEMRETVTQEIAAFRDRSHQRDLERLRQEEQDEARQKAQSNSSGNANAIPLGPRSGAAPTGPKGVTGVQIPKDYQKGVAFVNGTSNGARLFSQEEEESDASDEELERRRKARDNADLEKTFLDQERKWMNRERSRTAALERERGHEREEASRIEQEKQTVRQRLKDWDDDAQASMRREEYYSDRTAWLRNRAHFRQQEAAMDERDRNLEERERQVEQQRRNKEAGIADDFLAEQARELEQQLQKQPTREPMKFKMGLGIAAKKEQQTNEQQPRRTVAALEGLLEDEEDVARRERSNRQLMPIAEDASKHSGLSAEERTLAAQQLARDIPSDYRGLWAWSVKWDYVNVGVMSQVREFVEKRIIDVLGVMEERQVDIVEESLKKREKPQQIVEKLKPVSPGLIQK